MKNKLLLLLITLVPLHAAAQESTSANIIGVGSSGILDTYINQEKFSGIGFTYLYIKEHAKPEKRWNSIIEHELDLSTTKDRSKDNQMIEGSYNLYWGRYRHWQLLGDRLLLQAGGLANANLGFLYDMTTSNNPAQARLSLNLMPAGIATYHFPLFGKQFSLRYELNVPLVGIMFSPNYGQSYYEIFNRGNYDHNIVPTTLVSAPSFRQMLSLDWHTSEKWSLRVGYLGNYQQAEVNNLKQHIYAHRVMIGIVVRR
ncbi:MAG: DUF3316 domain-containing protein [Prevotella sp.]|nr:DUF3316 domain-containing protein [Prevotella sp.]